MNKSSANSVLDRLQQAVGVKSDSALSRKFGINRATLGNWRTRNSVPYSICVCFAIENHISLNWLLVGDGSMFCDGSGQGTEMLNSEHEKLIEMFDALSVEQRQEALQFMFDKKRINDLEKAVLALQQKP
ncbi:MAG: helix-turn-helix domain-containing protein [Methylobacter sp.]